MLKAKKKLTRKEIKQDKFVTYYFKTLDFYNAHKKEVHYALLAIVAVAALSFYVVNSKYAAEQKAAVELAKGKAAFQNGNYDVAIDVLSALTSDFSGTKSAGMGTLYLAKAYMAKKQYDLAEQNFKKYLDDYGDDPILSVSAAIGVAVTYDERGNYQKAAELYEQAAQKYKKSFKAPEMLLSAARCYKLAGKIEDARRVLNLLLKEHADSQYATDAKLFLAELRS
ncbi:MAG: outer membrane protein assembly factor BamD [Calditrichaeota bacterium]|nr:MAG: outer membrane protein assembly factor BamD [Calditrichota bacterium]